MSHECTDLPDASQSDVALTDKEILAFIARIQNGGGRRHYLVFSRPDGSAGEPG